MNDKELESYFTSHVKPVETGKDFDEKLAKLLKSLPEKSVQTPTPKGSTKE